MHSLLNNWSKYIYKKRFASFGHNANHCVYVYNFKNSSHSITAIIRAVSFGRWWSKPPPVYNAHYYEQRKSWILIIISRHSTCDCAVIYFRCLLRSQSVYIYIYIWLWTVGSTDNNESIAWRGSFVDLCFCGIFILILDVFTAINPQQC